MDTRTGVPCSERRTVGDWGVNWVPSEVGFEPRTPGARGGKGGVSPLNAVFFALEGGITGMYRGVTG